jgi:signal peptidase I
MAAEPGADSGAQPDAQAPAGQAPDAASVPPEQPRKRKHARPRKRSFWRDLIVIVVAALALTILLKAFVIQVFSIPTGSMENTLLPGDRILVSKIVYHFRPIARGDIVVFSGAGSWDPPAQSPGNPLVRIWDDAVNLVGIAGPETDYVKRVIGLPGDHVICCNSRHQVTVNGVPLSESSYIYPGAAPSEVPFNITVPPGRLWVMGDDRGDSDDSRYRTNDLGGGTIPQSAVVGRAFLIIWPLSRASDLPIPNTFKQPALSAAAALATALPPGAGGPVVGGPVVGGPVVGGPVVGGTVGGGTAVAAGAALAWRRRRRSLPTGRDTLTEMSDDGAACANETGERG